MKKISIRLSIKDSVVAPGGRTRPLRCFSIRVLSSASWSLSDVDCIAAGIGRVENLVRKSATFYTKFIKLNKRGKKRPKFTPFVCLRYRGAKSWGARCRSKGMAVRGLVSGVDPRNGEDERSEPFDDT